jgi:hypothetical protein
MISPPFSFLHPTAARKKLYKYAGTRNTYRSRAVMKGDNTQSQKFFKKHSLRVGNRITNAAGLTLRETIFPLFLVTILYFLWVRYNVRATITDLTVLPGICVWSPRHPQQALSKHPGNYSNTLFRSPSSVFWRLSSSIIGIRQLGPTKIWLSRHLHSWIDALWNRCPDDVACGP